MISLICPSRGRPIQFRQNIERWISRCGLTELEVIISLDEDEPCLSDPRYGVHLDKRFLKVLLVSRLVKPNKSSVEAINRAAAIARGNILIVVSDDQDCPINWGSKIERYTEGKSDFVLKVKDGFQQRIITMPIMDRMYYNRDRYIYHPKFDHLFADTYLTDVAYKRGRVISKNITFKHNQYSIIGTEPDEIYKKNNATYESGKRTYQELKKALK